MLLFLLLIYYAHIQLLLLILRVYPYSVPNVLTPNGDGMNDRFVITGLENETKITIYNRWGDVMFINDYTNDWEATGLTEGIYFYVLNESECRGSVDFKK